MRRGACLLSAVGFLAFIQFASAQQPSSELVQTAAAAAIVFRGQVIALHVEPARAPDEMTATRVTLRVEDGVRGAALGEIITVRQWNVAGDEYRVGETLVLFLHAPSTELGLTSPIGGRAGHRRLDEVPEAFLNSLRASAAPVQLAPPLPPPAPRPLRRTKSLRGRASEAQQ